MDDEKFNALMDEMIGGLPVTLVVARLSLCLKNLVEVSPEMAKEFEAFVEQCRDADRG